MAQITILFFASLRDELGVDEIKLNAEDVDDLMSQLKDRFGEKKVQVLRGKNIRIAVNKELIEGTFEFVGNEEVAFLPPVTGG